MVIKHGTKVLRRMVGIYNNEYRNIVLTGLKKYPYSEYTIWILFTISNLKDISICKISIW